MTERAPGYYWIKWRDAWVDDEPLRRPAPLVGEYDGKVWWFTRLDTYRFDSQVEVIAQCPTPSPLVETNWSKPELKNSPAEDKQHASA
jgi:hypothetical protein